MSQLLWDAAKAVLRGKYMAIQAYLKKEEQSQMNSLMSKSLKLEREEQMRPKVIRRRDIIKIREEINKIESNKKIAKINETKSWFFEKINKIDKPLARLIKRKKRMNTHEQNQKRERKSHDGHHRNTNNY